MGTISEYVLLHLWPTIKIRHRVNNLWKEVQAQIHRMAKFRAWRSLASGFLQPQLDVAAAAKPSVPVETPRANSAHASGNGASIELVSVRSDTAIRSPSETSPGKQRPVVKSIALATPSDMQSSVVAALLSDPRLVSQAWMESRRPSHDNFAQYSMLFVQLGYVALFSAAFALAPAAILVKNLFDMRLGARRLANLTRRPVAHQASGIGVWESILGASVAPLAHCVLCTVRSCARLLCNAFFTLCLCRHHVHLGHSDQQWVHCFRLHRRRR